MEDIPITKNDFNSDLIGMNKGEAEAKKKLLIIGGGVAALFIIVVIIILIVASNSGENNDTGEDNGSNKEVIGTIKCLYYIENTDQNAQIIGKDYSKNSNFDIYVDGKEIKFSKDYKFESIGVHEVEFKLYEDINMKNMFKDVDYIIEAEMISDSKCQVISMMHTFENCRNKNVK